MTTTESLDMIHMFYGIRQMYMQVWETAEKRFSMGIPAQELFDWCKHEYAEKDAFLERVIEDFKQVQSAQPEQKRGKWRVHTEVKNVYGGICIECTECGEKYVVRYIEDEKYCRNCGAKMEVQG